MLHIIKNQRGKFEVVLVLNGRMINTSNPQQYERKAGAINNIKAQMKYWYPTMVKYVQDDTGATPVIIVVYADKRKTEQTDITPPYKKYRQAWEK